MWQKILQFFNSSRRKLRLKQKSGFTLVELAIVLVVIGLIVGGVIQGQELIQQAKMKSAITDLQNLETALRTFELKYDCVAGDCPKASIFFSGGVNGNGDGLVGAFPYGSTYSEVWNVFTQLAAAKLITGTYTGVVGSADIRHSVPGQNVMNSKFSETAGFTYVNWNGYTDGHSFASPWVSPKQNVILFGSTAWNAYETFAPIMTPAQAYSFDAKIDDGFPGKGKLMLQMPIFFGACATSQVASTATYNMADDNGVYCGFIYVP